MRLVELTTVEPKIRLDIVYATATNFIGKAVYASAHCFVLESVALRLQRVQRALERRNLGLKVFDGYRPWSVTKIFWDFWPDPRYVADPAEGSRHNRGAAIDLTLVELQGKELSMPSHFDDFSEKAHHNYQGGGVQALKNREILKEAMLQEGFLSFDTEWWHYDEPGWEHYPILDLSFKELLQML